MVKTLFLPQGHDWSCKKYCSVWRGIRIIQRGGSSVCVNAVPWSPRGGSSNTLKRTKPLSQ